MNENIRSTRGNARARSKSATTNYHPAKYQRKNRTASESKPVSVRIPRDCALDELKLPAFIKTTGSRGFHVYVPIIRGPTQKEVWTVAKRFATTLASLYPRLITAEYRIAKRPRKCVLLDYNQNAWGRTLASIYSVRPQPNATVSTPITWKELQQGVRIEDFRIDNVPNRIKKLGDLWAPLLAKTGRVKLESLYGTAE